MALSITNGTTFSDSYIWDVFQEQLVAIDGYEPYVWTIEDDPDSMFTLNSGTGLLTCNVTAGNTPDVVDYVGSHSITVRVTDSHPVSPETITKTFTLNVLTSPNIFIDVGGTLTYWGDLGDSYLAPFVVGNTDTVQFVCVGGVLPITWSLDWSPAYVSVDNTGLLTVTPDAVEAYQSTVRVTDANGSTHYITPWIAAIASIGDPNVYAKGGAVGAFCANIGVVSTTAADYTWGGTPPYSYALAPGSDPLPDGGYFDGNLIYLTFPDFDAPPDFQSFNLTVRVTDSALTPSTYDYSREIPWSNRPVLDTATPLAVGQINTPYSFQLAITNTNTFAYSYTVDEINGIGLLPTGITVSSTGLFSGTTVFSNIFPISILASTDGTGCYDRWDTVLYITAGIDIACLPSTPPAVVPDTPYTIVCTATGGDAPYRWSFGINNPPPAGLLIDENTGIITGSIASNGTYLVDVIAQDSLDRIGLKTLTFLVANSSAIATDLGSVCKNSRFEYVFERIIAPGDPEFLYELVTGSLPIGLTLNSSGVISGIPTEPGTYYFEITATRTFGMGIVYLYGCTIVVFDSPVVQAPNFSFVGVGQPFEYTFSAVGGTLPLTWELSDVPDGLFFNSITGTLYGTPTKEGLYAQSITAFDGNKCADTLTFYLNVVGIPVILNPDLKIGCQNYAYQQFILVTGGAPPYYWFVVSEYGLPEGLLLDQMTGELHGIPTEYGTWPVTIKVIDAKGLTGEKDFSLVIRSEGECSSTDPGTILVQKPRLISVQSKAVTVADAFHQLYLFDYLPSVFKEEQ